MLSQLWFVAIVTKLSPFETPTASPSINQNGFANNKNWWHHQHKMWCSQRFFFWWLAAINPSSWGAGLFILGIQSDVMNQIWRDKRREWSKMFYRFGAPIMWEWINNESSRKSPVFCLWDCWNAQDKICWIYMSASHPYFDEHINQEGDPKRPSLDWF